MVSRVSDEQMAHDGITHSIWFSIVFLAPKTTLKSYIYIYIDLQINRTVKSFSKGIGNRFYLFGGHQKQIGHSGAVRSSSAEGGGIGGRGWSLIGGADGASISADGGTKWIWKRRVSQTLAAQERLKLLGVVAKKERIGIGI